MKKAKKSQPQTVMLVAKLPVDENGVLQLGDARGASAMAALFNAAELRCAKCGEKTCGCWTKCTVPGCSWSYETGTRCGNPAHAKKGRR